MATKVLGLVNGRVKFLWRKQSFLTYSLRRICYVMTLSEPTMILFDLLVLNTHQKFSIPLAADTTSTRFSTHKVNLPLRNSSAGQKTISHLRPKELNNLPAQIQLRLTVNTFKHDMEKLFFDKLQKEHDNILIYYYQEKRLPQGV